MACGDKNNLILGIYDFQNLFPVSYYNDREGGHGRGGGGKQLREGVSRKDKS